jgi:transcriptional regulator with XRE-family HTH domain
MRVLAKRIKEHRLKNGYTQDDMALKLNVNRANISNYERGIAKPPYDKLIKMAGMFHTTPDYLMGVEPSGDSNDWKARALKAESEAKRLQDKLDKIKEWVKEKGDSI